MAQTQENIETPLTSGATDNPDAPQSSVVAPPPLPQGYSRVGQEASEPQTAPPLPTGYKRPGQPEDKSLLDQASESPILTPTQKAVVGTAKAARGLYRGIMGDEESETSRGKTSTASPVAENLGFTPEHMGYAAGEMGRGVGKFVGGVAKDLNSPMPIVSENEPGSNAKEKGYKGPTFLEKYVEAPSAEEKQEALKEAQMFHQTQGWEAFGHMLNSYIHTAGEFVPMAGPFAAQLIKKAQTGDVGGALAQVAALKAGEKAQHAVTGELNTRVGNALENAKETPELVQARENVDTLGQELAKKQESFDAAKKAHDRYAASHAQGVQAPKPVVNALTKASEELAEAQFHHEAATEAAKKVQDSQPTLTQRAGTAVGNAVAKVLPKKEVPVESPAEEIEAAPVLQKLGAPKPPATPINVKTPGQVQPETFPQTPTEKPRTPLGRINLANDQGTFGKPPLLGEGTPEGPQVPATGLPQIKQEILPPEKPAAKPERGNVKALTVDDKGNVLDKEATPEGKLQKLLEESLKGNAERKATLAPEKKPEPAAEKTPVEEPKKVAQPKSEIIPEREPELVGSDYKEEKGSKTPEEYQAPVQEQVNALSDENLKKLAKAHNLNPDDYDFNTRDDRRHRTERNALVQHIVESMGDDEKSNLGRAAERVPEEGTFENGAKTQKSKAERAASLFPRLRVPVDEFGNPKVSGGAPDVSPSALEKWSDYDSNPDRDKEEEIEEQEKKATGYSQKADKRYPATVGTAEGAKSDTEHFTNAKKELGEKASISEVAKRAQELKDEDSKLSKEAGTDFPGAFDKDNFTTRRTTGHNMLDPGSLISGKEIAEGHTYENSSRKFKDEDHYVKALSGEIPTEKVVEGSPRSGKKSKDLKTAVSEYTKQEGLPEVKDNNLEAPTNRKQLSKAYDDMKHDPNNPEVKSSYNALVEDAKKQWDALKAAGIKLEPQDEDPYKSYEEMKKDFDDNKRLKIFRGGNELPEDHPLAKVDPKTGETYNVMFRGVHDAIGHLLHDNDFSEKGEENAYDTHRQTMSKEAIPAMTTETKAQVASYFDKGEFPEQKAGILPEEKSEYSGEERRESPRPATMTPTEIEDAMKNRKPFHTPFDVTRGAMDTIKRDQMMPKHPAEEAQEAQAGKAPNYYGEEMKYENSPMGVDKSNQQHHVVTSNDEGRKIGELVAQDTKPGEVTVRSNQIYDEDLKGKGRGTDQITHLLDNVDDKTKTVKSDISTSDAARKAWEKIMKFSPEAVTKQTFKDGQTQYTVDMSKWRGEHLPTVSGGAPEAKAVPTSEQMLKKYGESDGDPSHTAFILSDGKGVKQLGLEHSQMAGGVANLPKFVNQEGAIRMRAHGAYGNRQFNLSLPEDGITVDQLKELNRMAPQISSGKVYLEAVGSKPVAEPGDFREIEYGKASDELEGAIRDLVAVKNDKGSPVDVNGNPTVSGGSPAAGTAAGTAEAKTKPLPKLAEEHLTEEEKEGVTKSEAGRKAFVENLKKLPTVQEFTDIAKAGEGGRKWYQRSAAAFDALTEEAPKYFKDGDRQKFTDFLAALSPQQSVKMNLGEALNAWTRYVDEGRPTGKDLEKLLKDEVTLPGAKVPNALKALAGEPLWPDLSKNSNFKVPSFAKNLNGYLNHVTNDGWQALFGGLDAKEISRANSYHPLAVVTRAAADALGWEPAEAQAAIWAFTKVFTEKGETEPSDIRRRSEDFADIIAMDPEIRQQLERLGVNHEQLDAKLRAIGKKPPVTPGASPTTENSVRKLRTRIEGARGKGTIPPPKSGSLNFEPDEETEFNPEDFGKTEASPLEKLGKKKSPLGRIK